MDHDVSTVYIRLICPRFNIISGRSLHLFIIIKIQQNIMMFLILSMKIANLQLIYMVHKGVIIRNYIFTKFPVGCK